MRQYLHRLGLRYALRSLRALKGGNKPNATLLTEQRRSGSVALVWALDQSGETLSEEVLAQLEKLSVFETVVVVCPPRFFPALRRAGHFFETLPAAADILKSETGSNWNLYLRRRVVRIRENWGPDFEVVVGPEPESFIHDVSDQAS